MTAFACETCSKIVKLYRNVVGLVFWGGGILVFCLPGCLCEDVGSPRTGVKNCCELSCGYWIHLQFQRFSPLLSWQHAGRIMVLEKIESLTYGSRPTGSKKRAGHLDWAWLGYFTTTCTELQGVWHVLALVGTHRHTHLKLTKVNKCVYACEVSKE